MDERGGVVGNGLDQRHPSHPWPSKCGALRLRRLSTPGATRWVTITAGGNDVGFSSAIRRCAERRSSAGCASKVKRAERLTVDDLPFDLDALYREIRLRAPAASVIVVGYPRLFTTEDCIAANVLLTRRTHPPQRYG
jgi:lysophospholipase L1-like esterase